MINKKAQTQQVFIYIMVILVVGGLLLIGFRSINNILNQGCEVEFANFKTSLQNQLNQNNRFGFVELINIRRPCDYTALCFAGENNQNPVINASVKANAENVFIVRNNIYEPLFIYEPLNNQTGQELCINASGGRFQFVAQGVARGKINISLP